MLWSETAKLVFGFLCFALGVSAFRFPLLDLDLESGRGRSYFTFDLTGIGRTLGTGTKKNYQLQKNVVIIF